MVERLVVNINHYIHIFCVLQLEMEMERGEIDVAKFTTVSQLINFASPTSLLHRGCTILKLTITAPHSTSSVLLQFNFYYLSSKFSIILNVSKYLKTKHMYYFYNTLVYFYLFNNYIYTKIK